MFMNGINTIGVLLIAAIGQTLQTNRTVGDTGSNSEILKECWEEFETNHYNDTQLLIEKFENYNYCSKEKIPCFALCLAGKKSWFDIKNHRWHKQNIVNDLGINMYNYCRYELNRQFQDVCKFAFEGLKCLKEAEVNVFIKQKYLFECAKEQSANLEKLWEYYILPEVEPIPCLFKCIADKLQLYDAEYDWVLANWLKAFGPIRDANYNLNTCRLDLQQRQSQSLCATLYAEFYCWEHLNSGQNTKNQ